MKSYENRLSSIFPPFFRPGGIPARNHKGERLLLYLGIIDILQSYRLRKKLEHTIKAIIQDAVSHNHRDHSIHKHHRDKTRVQMPAKIFPHLKVK